MSASINIEFICPPDEKYDKMKQVWNLCKEMNIEVPEEVGTFFNWEEPSIHGTIIYQPDCLIKANFYNESMIEVEKIPSNIKFIRITLS